MECAMGLVIFREPSRRFLHCRTRMARWARDSERVVMDASSQAFLALWDTGGHVGAQLDIEGTNEMGVEAGGRPTLLTGIAVSELKAKNIHGVLEQ